jgi:hypothetical protein
MAGEEGETLPFFTSAKTTIGFSGRWMYLLDYFRSFAI